MHRLRPPRLTTQEFRRAIEAMRVISRRQVVEGFIRNGTSRIDALTSVMTSTLLGSDVGADVDSDSNSSDNDSEVIFDPRLIHAYQYVFDAPEVQQERDQEQDFRLPFHTTETNASLQDRAMIGSWISDHGNGHEAIEPFDFGDVENDEDDDNEEDGGKGNENEDKDVIDVDGENEDGNGSDGDIGMDDVDNEGDDNMIVEQGNGERAALH